MSVNEKMTSIANAIRAITGETSLLTLDSIAEAIPGIYVQAAEEEKIKLWKAITNNGNRQTYESAFSYSNFEGYSFIYAVKVIGNAYRMFMQYKGKTLPKNIDMSDMNPSGKHVSIFANSSLEEIYDMNMPALDAYNNTYYGCGKLKTIAKIRSNQNTTYFQTFKGCESLEKVSFSGEIWQDIDFSESPKLTSNSLSNIIAHLHNYAGSNTKHVLKIGAENIKKLSNSLKETVKSKNWDLE